MLTSEALAAGRPHLLLPQHRETALNAMLVTNLGYGSKVDPPAGAPEFYSAVRTFLADEALERRTFDFANLLLDRPLPDVGDQLVAAIAALAAPQDLRLEAASAAPAS